MKRLITIGGQARELEIKGQNGAYSFAFGPDPAREASLIAVAPGTYSVLLDGRSYEVKVAPGPDGYFVEFAGSVSVVQVRDPRSLTQHSRGGAREGRQTISAPMPGKVVRVLVKEGDQVEAGAGLVVVEAMKMQNELKAPKAGRIVQLKAVVGATVKNGEMLAAIE